MDGLLTNVSLLTQSSSTINFGVFPGGPVVKTLCFHCRGHRFSLVGELRSHMSCEMAKE